MPPIEIRPFRRSDRDQLTALVNAHIEAVLPGVGVSTNAVLSQLEREPGEYVVDPWVTVRHTLVAVHRDRIAGAAHLLRYGDDERVGPGYRDAGEIRWLVFWPGQSAAQVVEMTDVADALAAAALAELRRWAVTRLLADGTLPAPAVYGIPDRWPHVAAALRRAGFVAGERMEVVLAAEIGDLPRGGPPPVDGLTLRVALGGHGTRFTAVLDDPVRDDPVRDDPVRDDVVLGRYEVESDLTAGGTLSRLAGWADGCELWVHPEYRRRGVATWLVGQGADRLRFAGVTRVLDYDVLAPAADTVEGVLPFLTRIGFRELTRTLREWTLSP